jgi:hypothetical protein
MSRAVYVYGVLSTPGARTSSPAIDAWSGNVLGTGIDARAIEVLVAGELSALVSSTTGNPIARSRRHLLDHTSVLERAMRHATILPLRFGTVAPDEAALIACIAANGAAFLQALHDIDGRVELGLKASWRKGRVFNDIVERDHALRQMRDKLQTRPAGETYYERIELGRRVEAALAERRAAEAAAIIAELAPLAERAADLRTHDEDMILNRAFLVPRTAETAFDEAVARIAERYGERMDFRYVGPVPPFNFVTLHAGWLTAPSPAHSRSGAA